MTLGHCLIIGITDGEINTYNSLFIHVGNCIASTATNTNYFNDGGFVIGYIEHIKDGVLKVLKMEFIRIETAKQSLAVQFAKLTYL
jgi:hypothetical protein